MARRVQLRPTLNVGLQQRLAMTPSLLQKIELLTLSRLELSEMLQAELAENPVLEEGAAGSESAEAQAESEREPPESDDDFDYEYFFGEYLNSTPRGREREFDADRPSFDLFLADQSSLTDHLNWQLNLASLPPDILEIARYIVGNIDEDGYLGTSVEEIQSALEAKTTRVERALTVVQSFDPAGVGARDLAECLLLQLRALELDHVLVVALVDECLELLEGQHYDEIARRLECDRDDVEEAVVILRRLTPTPGQKYSSRKPQYIQPDVYISKDNGEFQINMNDDGMPRLSLSREYRRLLKDVNTSKETKSFIKEKVRSAMELLKSVDQREQTIYKVCEAIISRQKEFLDRGLLKLKPMLIKDIAEELGVHSSTISRVVANKYAHTPQGVLELRRFFTVGIEGSDGENVSIVQVKEKIRKIIEDENLSRPHSDQKITDMLNVDGINITRRTVAKYRDQLNIPGSRTRRRR